MDLLHTAKRRDVGELGQCVFLVDRRPSHTLRTRRSDACCGVVVGWESLLGAGKEKREGL